MMPAQITDQAQRAAEDAAVNAQAAFPDGEHAREVEREAEQIDRYPRVVEIELKVDGTVGWRRHHVIESRADQSDDQRHKYRVPHVVGVLATSLGNLGR